MNKIRQTALSLFMALFTAQIEAHDLISVYREAISGDPQLERARESLEAIQESQTQANAALYLPEAHLSANVYGDTQSVQLSQDSTGVSGRSNFMAGGYVLSLTQPLLHYDRIIGADQSDRRVAQAEAEYAAAETALLLRVAERYFEVLSAQENLNFARIQEQSLARELQETQQFQAAGFLAKTDVRESQAGYDRALADTIETEHQFKDALEGLQEVTGNRYTKLAGLRETLPLIEPEPAIEEAWIQQALKQNFGLIATERWVQTAKEEIQRLEAGHLPTLDVVGSHSFSTSGGRFGSADIRDTAIGLSLNVPIYQGGRVNSRIREAGHRYRETLAKLKQEQRAVHRAASKAFLGVTAGISRIKALERTLLSTEAAVAATTAGFRVGRRTALDVIVAEREQLRAKRDYAKARYDYLLNTLRLKQTVGTLSPNDLAQVNKWLAL